jgi:hypothetical protein
MCFGGGVTAAQKEQQAEAKAAREREQDRISEQKRDDIEGALSSRTVGRFSGSQGGTGRRSLFTSSSGGSGFLNRFLL